MLFQGYTPLHIAMQFDHENIFNLLVQVYGKYASVFICLYYESFKCTSNILLSYNVTSILKYIFRRESGYT